MLRELSQLFPSLDAAERELFASVPADRPWEVLADLEGRIRALAARMGGEPRGGLGEGVHVGCDGLFVAEGARLEPTAVLVGGPVYVGPGAEIRAGARLRGPVFLGAGAVVGHAAEVEASVLLHGAEVPHFAYVGDSVLGPGANLGAGTALANLRLDGRSVRVEWNGRRVDSGLRRLGALLGEGAGTACNVVLNPGTVLRPGEVVLPDGRRAFMKTDEKAKAGEEIEQLVVLELDGQTYGADIGSVREVLAFQPITRLPEAPPFVLGVIDLRGRIIPVIDLRRRLGLGAAEPGPLSRIVVVEDGEELVGMLVDGVSEVLDVPAGLVEPPGELVRGEDVSFLRGVARLEERLVILLALDRVLDARRRAADSPA